MNYRNIHFELRDGIARIVLGRPSTLNALSQELLVELRHALESVEAAPEAHCLVLTGEGRGFSSGADLTAPRTGLDPDDPDRFLRDFFIPPFRQLAELRIPTIAAVNGVCAGAGMSLALSCDIVVAEESAYFLQPFVNIGLVPDLGSSWLLPRAVGRSRALALMLLGERLPAREAKEWGLIWKCCSAESFDAQVQGLAHKFAAAPRIHGAIKQLVREGFGSDLNSQMALEMHHQREAIRSADHLEARAAFREKRKPDFSHSRLEPS